MVGYRIGVYDKYWQNSVFSKFISYITFTGSHSGKADVTYTLPLRNMITQKELTITNVAIPFRGQLTIFLSLFPFTGAPFLNWWVNDTQRCRLHVYILTQNGYFSNVDNLLNLSSHHFVLPGISYFF